MTPACGGRSARGRRVAAQSSRASRRRDRKGRLSDCAALQIALQVLIHFSRKSAAVFFSGRYCHLGSMNVPARNLLTQTSENAMNACKQIARVAAGVVFVTAASVIVLGLGLVPGSEEMLASILEDRVELDRLATEGRYL